MAVTIDSGPVEAENLLRHVPENKWRELMLARRRFLEIQLSYDCRCLVTFVNDAELMYAALGFGSVEQMIRDGYGLKPAEIQVAVEWLQLNPPDEPISLDGAITKALGKRGRPKKGEEKGCNATLKRGTAAHWLARLDRDGFAELAAKVRAGDLSANAAAIEAGFRKQPTPLEIALKQIKKMTRADLQELVRLIQENLKAAA